MTSRRQWRAAVVLVHLCVYIAATQDQRKALFPSAYRIRRGTFSLQNPAFQRSPGDADLLFELLLTGMQVLGEDAAVWIPDRELASLRRVRHLEVICEDVLPKRLPDVRRLTAELDRWRRRPLGGRDFERTVLTLVFAAQTLGRVAERWQKEVWAEAVIRLFTAVQRDLGVF